MDKVGVVLGMCIVATGAFSAYSSDNAKLTVVYLIQAGLGFAYAGIASIR
jgi:hypothetical protein